MMKFSGEIKSLKEKETENFTNFKKFGGDLIHSLYFYQLIEDHVSSKFIINQF